MSGIEFYCNDCNKYFSSKQSLTTHFTTNKHKLKNQKQTNQCIFCNKNFDSNFLLQRHEATCKEKPIIEQQAQHLLEIKELEQKYLLMIKELKEEHQNQIKKLIKDHDNEYNNIVNENANFKGLYYDVKDKLNQKEKLYNEQSKEFESVKHKYEALLSIQPLIKPTIQYNTTNNINNNIINVVSSFKPITEAFVSKQMENISAENLARVGPCYIIDHAMNSEIGSNIVVTDPSRHSIAYKNKYNEVVRDKHSDELISMLINTTAEQEALKRAIELATIKYNELTGTPEFNRASDTLFGLGTMSSKDPEQKLNPKLRNKLTKKAPSIDTANQKIKNETIQSDQKQHENI
jgi:hypothetical protein